MTPESPEIVEFATRMYDAARAGDGSHFSSLSLSPLNSSPTSPPKRSIPSQPPGPRTPSFSHQLLTNPRPPGIPHTVATLTQALSAGLPPNLTNSKGDTLLMLASYHGHLALTQELLQRGADPNRLNDRGQSPLAGAVFKAEPAIVECLLEHGADVDVGTPSAMQSIEIFRQRERWGQRFEAQRERLLKERGKVREPGGMKESTQVA